MGPGLVGYEGRHIQQPFARAYGGSDGDVGASVVENWEGPNLYAERGATLLFADGSCIIRPTPDLTLTGECLVGTTGTDDDRFGWAGFMRKVPWSYLQLYVQTNPSLPASPS